MDEFRHVEEVAGRIASMEIRGAAKIAQSAALALKRFAMEYSGRDAEDFRKKLEKAAEILLSSRPTAVSLPNAVSHVLMHASDAESVEELREAVARAADEFVRRSERAIAEIGRIGARRISSGDVVMTHCNSRAAHRSPQAGQGHRGYSHRVPPQGAGLHNLTLLSRAGHRCNADS
ncbi:MAG: hypothetical protein GXN98_02335 [Euryarchaeota archaeon]|nr:hypothetical protein [Euryarchaeota archaeon]